MINLLPPQYKEKIRAAKKIRMIFNVGIFFIVCILVFWLSLMIIDVRINTIKENQSLLTRVEHSKVGQLNIVKGKINQVNGLISEINKFYEEQIYVSDLLVKVSNILGQEVTLNNLSFDKNTKKVVLSGTVKTLQGLNELKDTLNTQTEFRAMNLSIPSYIPKEDISFAADFIFINEQQK